MRIKRTRVTTVETHSVTISERAAAGNADKPADCIDCEFFIRAMNDGRNRPDSETQMNGLNRLRRIMKRIRGK